MAPFSNLPYELVIEVAKKVAASDVCTLLSLQQCSHTTLNATTEAEVLKEVRLANLLDLLYRYGYIEFPDIDRVITEGFLRMYNRYLCSSNPSVMLHEGVLMYFNHGTKESNARNGHFNTMYAVGVLSVSRLGEQAIFGIEMLSRCLATILAVGNDILWQDGHDAVASIFRHSNEEEDREFLGYQKRLCNNLGCEHVDLTPEGNHHLLNLRDVVCHLCQMDLLVHRCIGGHARYYGFP